jgi:hypothetical protein
MEGTMVGGQNSQGIIFRFPSIKGKVAIRTACQILALFVGTEVPAGFSHLSNQSPALVHGQGYLNRRTQFWRLTFSALHAQPRLPSCGHEQNVASLASAILGLVGSSISAGLEDWRAIFIITAHPHSLECRRCSMIGSSSSSQPSRALSHR